MPCCAMPCQAPLTSFVQDFCPLRRATKSQSHFAKIGTKVTWGQGTCICVDAVWVNTSTPCLHLQTLQLCASFPSSTVVCRVAEGSDSVLSRLILIHCWFSYFQDLKTVLQR